MPHNSMAPFSSPSSPYPFPSHDHERLDLESIRMLVISINQHVLELVSNSKTRNSLKLKSTSKLKIQKQEFFEFSEHSVLSNLYWGIESIETAIREDCPEEKIAELRKCERMLQVPALLHEHGVTAGIANQYLVCCSYFYLSMVRKLQKDDLQVALHFLQALLVSPRHVWTELAPEICTSIFPLSGMQEAGGRRRSLSSGSLANFGEDEVDEAMRQTARRYKDRLMYYQVILYGETPQWHSECRDVHLPDDKSKYSMYRNSVSSESSNSIECGNSFQTYNKLEKVHPLDPLENITDDTIGEARPFRHIPGYQDYQKGSLNLDQVCSTKRSSNIKCLQDMLTESQSDTPISIDSDADYSAEEDDSEANAYDTESSIEKARIKAENPQPEFCHQRHQAPSSISSPECTAVVLSHVPRHPVQEEANAMNMGKFFPGRFDSSISNLALTVIEPRHKKSLTSQNFHVENTTTKRGIEPHDLQFFNHMSSSSLQSYRFSQTDLKGIGTREKQTSRSRRISDQMIPEKDFQTEAVGIVENAISRFCFSEAGKSDEDYSVEVTKIYEVLNNKVGIQYTMLKDLILDILLSAISTSKEKEIIRASVSILTTIISEHKSAVEDIKKKGLQLCDLANALKIHVHEAAILIYLINPSPTEIKTMELLPTLVEVVCTSNNYKSDPVSLLPTPPVASLMIIEILVTAFDYATNNMHLAEISSPEVLSCLLDVARNDNIEELVALATILVKCIQFDGQCRRYVAQLTPLAPFVCLLGSDKPRAKFIALEFFYEILHMPRSSAISILEQIKKEGSVNVMHVLFHSLQQLQPEYQLFAASLLLQLDMVGDSAGKKIYREEAMKVLLESVASEECPTTQQLSAFILSNLGGTYAWTGEPYTVAWLMKRAGLNSLYHRNMIKNYDWLDQSLQDAGTHTWCSKIARRIIKVGNPVFHALEKGIKSKTEGVSRDCLTAIAWLGCEISRSPKNLRYCSFDILLTEIVQFLHPGSELDERLLACVCIYNYASGKGMQKLIHFSEGVRESLRRLSNITWMADELLRVSDYFMPNKSQRISCVHTQVLEAAHKCSGAVSALIYYRGQLYSGYSDGSIKVWDIKGQSATLVMDMKAHKKAVTCFSLFEPGGSLLSGSADKTIKVWQMIEMKLECTEIIATEEPIQSLDTCGQLIFAVTQSNCLKVFDASRTVKDVCKGKHVKCIRVVHKRIYIGCLDSRIQELTITNNREQEIKTPAKGWRTQNKPITSIVVYKDWLYSASAIVEGSNFQEWRRHCKPQMSIATGKGANVVAMGVVEDFIYLNCSSSDKILQIWLRGSQQKVGRISAGSRITSLLTANDIVLCGTETGLIKGWIPL